MQFVDRRIQSCAQIRRLQSRRGTENAEQDRGAEHSFPPKLPPTEQDNQHGRHQKRRSAGDHKGDVGEKKNGESEQPRDRAPPTRAGIIECDRKKDERTHQKVAALQDIILDRNAERARVPREGGKQHEQTGKEQHADHRCKKSKEHPHAMLGSAKLRQQQGNDQQPIEWGVTAEAFAPAHVGPEQAEAREPPQHDRQAARGGRKLAPDGGNIQRRQDGQQPERDENSGRRCRPRQRNRDRDREPVGACSAVRFSVKRCRSQRRPHGLSQVFAILALSNLPSLRISADALCNLYAPAENNGNQGAFVSADASALCVRSEEQAVSEDVPPRWRACEAAGRTAAPARSAFSGRSSRRGVPMIIAA